MLRAMLTIGSFALDGTPPAGSSTGFGVGDPTTGVRDPLLIRGFVLRGTGDSVVVVSADWCGLMGSALRDLKGALAAGAGTSADRVVVHCVHQHDAPLVDFEIEPLLGVRTFPREWWKALLDSSGAAARDAAAGASPVAEVGWAETRLRGYASNRRILGADGRVRGMRFSRCSDPALVAAPVGLIDPMLRTVAFRGQDGQTLASMSFYATHPQVSNGRHLYSADAPGEAVRLLGSRHPGRHAFFTGAGGNVTAGKHSSPTDLEGNLLGFGALLADGMTRNFAAMQWEPAGELGWREASFPFPANPAKREAARATLANPAETVAAKLIAAPVLAAMDDPANATYRVKLLSLGSASLLFLPGEPFVEHQLYAQSVIPDRFLAVAANCGDDFLYLPAAASFPQGGYEVESFCWCTPELEGRMRAAMQSLLA